MRALVLSGGGSYGAFQAGVIRCLAEQKHTWDVISGVSVGSLNGTILAMYAPDNQLNGAYRVEAFWKAVQGNASIYKPRFLGLLAGLFNPSLNDDSPLEKLVKDNLDFKALRRSRVKLRVGATDLVTGDYAHGTEQDDNLATWIMASCAMPLLFPPRKINGHGAWVDGGVRHVSPILDALSEEGITEADIIICGPLGQPLTPSKKKFVNVLEVGMRSVEILADEVLQTDIPQALERLKGKNIKLNVFSPTAHFDHDAFDFSPVHINKLLHLGEVAAKDSLTSRDLLDRSWN